MLRSYIARASAAFLCLIAIILQTGSAAADVPASGPQSLELEYQKLNALARQARTKGTLPRLADPDAADVLNAIWDGDAILGSAPYTEKDMPALLQILDRESQVLKSYALFSAAPSTLPDTARNGAIFQDEIVRSNAMLVRTTAAALSAMNDFVAHLKPEDMTDVRRQGLAQARLGLQQMVSAAVLMLRDPGISGQNQSTLAQTLAANAQPIAQAITVEDRAAMIAAANSAKSSISSEARTALQDFTTAMSDPTCKGLCRFH